MNERRQIDALARAFLGRFFENEISDGTRDVRTSFTRMIGMLAAPGFLLPFSKIYDWGMLSPEELRWVSIADKTVYLSVTMAAMMLLAAVVWQALLVDRRDAIVLGSYPVRPRTIIAGKIAALVIYLGIVAAGMNIVASLAYGLFLGGGAAGMLRAVPAHFIASVVCCMAACLAIAAFQALVLAIGGPRVFSRVTASAQLVLAAASLLVLLMGPAIGAAAMDVATGSNRLAWAAWLPPVWFAGLYETIGGGPSAAMPAMALRALLFFAGVIAVLVMAYPIAYRRIASAALRGSPIGSRRSLASVALERMVRQLPLRHDVRGAVHFICLTIGRVARNKLIIATALGAALALALPFLARWSGATWMPPVPGRSHIGVPFVFMLFGLAGIRMSYNVPAEAGAAWIFSTAVRPARIGTSGARVTALLVAATGAFAVCFPAYLYFWGFVIALSASLTVFAFGAVIAEIGLRSVDFVPFTRAYNPERGRLQARWPLYLIGLVLALQFLPFATRLALITGAYWLMPALLGVLAAGLWAAHPPEPPPLVDADLENKPLALRLY